MITIELFILCKLFFDNDNSVSWYFIVAFIILDYMTYFALKEMNKK